MAKKSKSRKPAAAGIQSSGYAQPPRVSPDAFGPPAPLIPPANGVVLRLGPGERSFIIDLPMGAQVELRGDDPDTLMHLLGILRRVRGEAAAAIQPKVQVKWPRGLELRFCPPNPSPWREAAFFPAGADFIPVTVVCEMAHGGVLCTAPDGKNYKFNEKHLRVAGEPKMKGKPKLELIDLEALFS